MSHDNDVVSVAVLKAEFGHLKDHIDLRQGAVTERIDRLQETTNGNSTKLDNINIHFNRGAEPVKGA